jgi:hypothetical protein
VSWTVWGMVAAVGKAKVLEAIGWRVAGWTIHPRRRAKDSSVIVQSSLFRVLMSYLRRAKDRCKVGGCVPARPPGDHEETVLYPT